LAVLRALNANNHSTAADLTAATGLPRGTIYRLLDTLIAQGYVMTSDNNLSFSLRPRVSELSAAFALDRVAVEACRAEVDALAARMDWPCALLAFDGADLRIAHSTHGRLGRRVVSRPSGASRVPLLETAAGRILLATLKPADRRPLMDRAIAERAGSGFEASSDAAAELVSAAARAGYGYRDGGLVPGTVSIALPIQPRTCPTLIVSAMFLRSWGDIEAAARRYLPAIRSAVCQMESALSARSSRRAPCA
jgi:IclR family mhp operon transcriptional activator